MNEWRSRFEAQPNLRFMFFLRHGNKPIIIGGGKYSVMTIYPKDIEAEVVFVLPEHEGRKGPIISGLRPLFYYDGKGWDGVMFFDIEEQIPKGIPVTMYFAFLSPQNHLGKVYPGKEFQLRDGPKVIANGRVLRLIALLDSANKATQELCNR